MAEPDARRRFRAVVDTLAGGDGDLGDMNQSVPALTEVLRDFAAPDFEVVMCPLPPTSPVSYPGLDGLEKAWGDFGSAFEKVHAKLLEVRESETHAILLVDQIATTRHGGVEISQPSAMVFEFAGNQVKRIEFHLDQAEALRVAGIEP